jgi:hypothetical protein
MKQVKNKKTGVIKEPRTQVELSMYIATNEWELVEDQKKETKSNINIPKSNNEDK